MLNGVSIRDVVEAHTAEGWVKRYNREAYKPGMEEMPTEILKGVVYVKIGERQ